MSAPALDLSRPMLRARRFWSLLGAQSLGSFADNALRAAAIVAIASAWRAGAAAGDDFHVPVFLASEAGTWVGLCFTAPIFLFSMISGQLADRIDRHVLIRWVKTAEVLLMLAAAVFFAAGNAYGLLLFLFLMGVQSAFLAPTRAAMMPQYFPGRELMRANGYFQGVTLIAIVLGLAAGAVLVALEGGRTLISLTLIGAAAGGLLCAFRTPAAPSPGLTRMNWNIASQALRMYRDVARMPGVLWPMLGVGWFWGVGAIVLANLENFVAAIGGVSSDFAAFQALFAIGTGLGSVAAGAIASRMRDPMLLSGLGLAATVACSAAITAVSLDLAASAGPEPASLVANVTTGVATLAVLIVLTAASNGFFVVPLLTAVQARAPETERARVLGTQNMTNGGMATAMGLMVPPSRVIGLTPITLFLGLGVLQGVVLVFMWRRRAAHRQGGASGPASSPVPAK
ncbi:MFS transporter [Parvularcula oceani]|uniref:MFS transporter n=1 Tax=Parvularcula oceani TaxID=1247963 RepID=UPI00138DECA1|nr:MFS transporter [Parvularcula oceani]